MSIGLIRRQLATVLNKHRTKGLLTYADDDIFEAYLFSIVIEGARAVSGTIIDYVDGNGRPVTELQFRRSPGNIASSNKTFTHAVITFAGREPLEVHVGVKVNGVSRVDHECDVAVLRKAECDRSRSAVPAVLPRSSGLLLAIEGKFYATPLDKSIGRAQLGLGREFFNVPLCLVANIRSDDVVAMVLHHGLHADDAVLPGTHEHAALVHRISDILRRYMRKR